MEEFKPLITEKEITEAVKHAIDANMSVKAYLRPKSQRKNSPMQAVKRFEQQVKLAFRNPELSKLILDIRKELNMPTNGFNINDRKELFQWIKDHKKTNYTAISYIVNKYPIIHSYPSALLDELLDDDQEEYETNQEIGLVKYGSGVISNFYTNTEIYKNHITEKPFTGIFEFILFNKLIVPINKEIATIRDESNSTITLVISANTTKRDFLDAWTEISSEQKKLLDYSKSKKRIKPKLEEGLKFLNIAAENEQAIKKSGKKGKEAQEARSGNICDSIDEVFGAETDFSTDHLDKRRHARRRQKIYRIKKLTGTK